MYIIVTYLDSLCSAVCTTVPGNQTVHTTVDKLNDCSIHTIANLCKLTNTALKLGDGIIFYNQSQNLGEAIPLPTTQVVPPIFNVQKGKATEVH